MAHLRNRRILPLFRKKAKFWPVICLFGPRQSGKTTLLRDLLLFPRASIYRTLDQAAQRRLARSNPALYLSEGETDSALIIDEAHKAPDLFDEIKSIVDQKKRPCSFVLSGSVKFSKKIGVREALTGRSANIYLDTLSLKETLEKADQSVPLISLAAVKKYLDRGGMPGVCFLRAEAEIASYWEEWLNTTCELDLKMFSSGKLSDDLARRVLEALVKCETPDALSVAKKLGVDTRRVKNHLDALKDLFVVHEVAPHPKSETGKELYYVFDSGLANHLGADLHRRWQSHFLVEYRFSAQNATKVADYRLGYFKSRAGMLAEFVVGQQIHLFSETPTPSPRLQKSLKALAMRFQDHKIQVHCPTQEGIQLGATVRIVPWSELVL